MKHFRQSYEHEATDFYFEAAPESVFVKFNPNQTILVTDENLERLYGDYWANFPSIVVRAGEVHKNIDELHRIYEGLLAHRAHRGTHLLAVGGGMVSDLAGFAAASFMRGLPISCVPTTLLAQVDASIGGKNGINFGLFKNMIGTVRQPNSLFFCTEWLKTLPITEYTSGFAEVIKYALIDEKVSFEELEIQKEAFWRQERNFLDEVVRCCVKAKNRLVAQDPQEKTVRRLLNFGHTIGHPLEKILQIPHGHAVAIGMVLACRLSEKYLGFSAEKTQRVRELLEAYGLPTAASVNPDEVLDLLLHDKKKDAQHIHFILLEDIGRPVIYPIAQSALGAELASLLKT